jgi:hypothetical protein
MIKLVDILNEAKQVGPLYHWTDFMGSLNIISQNFLKGYLTDTFKQPAISFTRDKNFYKGKNKLATKPEICFVIDGDKLSNHYKIQPFQDSTIKKDEMEEKAITEGIRNFSQYITKIIIIKNRFNSSSQYSPSQIEDKWKNVGGEGYPNYKKYIEWLTNKGFNIETTLKELNIQPKTPIGKGSEQTAYPFKSKPGYIIKKFTSDSKYYTKEDWTEIIKIAQQHPEIFAKIDRVDFDKGYFVQEKLDEKSLTKDGIELYNYLKDNNILYRNNQDKNNYSGLDIISILYMEPDRMSMLDNTPWEKTLKPKLKRLFNKLNQSGYGINDNYLGDFRLTNVGYDENREIKILDFNFGEL